MPCNCKPWRPCSYCSFKSTIDLPFQETKSQRPLSNLEATTLTSAKKRRACFKAPWPASQKVLELAAKAADREVAARAKAVIDNVRVGVFPDTPSAVVQLISQFRAADDNQRPKMLRRIHDMSQPRAVIAQVVSEPDMYRRRALAKEILEAEQQKVTAALAIADYAKAEESLAPCSAN